MTTFVSILRHPCPQKFITTRLNKFNSKGALLPFTKLNGKTFFSEKKESMKWERIYKTEEINSISECYEPLSLFS